MCACKDCLNLITTATNFQLSRIFGKFSIRKWEPRSQESRPRFTSRTKASSPLSPEDPLKPPYSNSDIKRKSNQDEDDTETEFLVCAILYAAYSNIPKAERNS